MDIFSREFEVIFKGVNRGPLFKRIASGLELDDEKTEKLKEILHNSTFKVEVNSHNKESSVKDINKILRLCNDNIGGGIVGMYTIHFTAM